MVIMFTLKAGVPLYVASCTQRPGMCRVHAGGGFGNISAVSRGNTVASSLLHLLQKSGENMGKSFTH